MLELLTSRLTAPRSWAARRASATSLATGNLRDWDVTDRLGEIDVPTLFVSGEYDEIRPAHVRDMHDQVPGSELHHYANSAHLPFEEERERFMADYNDFLARTESA